MMRDMMVRRGRDMLRNEPLLANTSYKLKGSAEFRSIPEWLDGDNPDTMSDEQLVDFFMAMCAAYAICRVHRGFDEVY